MNFNRIQRLTVGEELQGQEKMHQEMCVLFALLHGSDRIANGSFIVAPEQGTSCFGNYQEAEVVLDKEHTIRTGLFEGVIFVHNSKLTRHQYRLDFLKLLKTKRVRLA
jgi:hypothetical protein